jgi:hypothetical protein
LDSHRHMRASIVFRPACGKSHGDVSRQLPMIERIIKAAGGQDFAMHPHDSAAYCFTLGVDTDPVETESIVHALNALRDEDGRGIVDAEQGGYVTAPSIQAVAVDSAVISSGPRGPAR